MARRRIGGSPNDPFWRYMMPPLSLSQSGGGTMILNLEPVMQAIGRHPHCTRVCCAVLCLALRARYDE